MDWTTGPPDTWNPMADWLRSLAADLPGAPKAILVISGHWEENEFSVSCTGQPSLIYDYYGFPEHTYSISYPVAGAPELADRVQALLVASHIPCVKNPVRGLDHGVEPCGVHRQAVMGDSLKPQTHVLNMSKN